MRLQNKIAVITGSANGIGLAAAKRFVQEGCRVAMVDFDEEKGSAEAQKLKRRGRGSRFLSS